MQLPFRFHHRSAPLRASFHLRPNLTLRSSIIARYATDYAPLGRAMPTTNLVGIDFPHPAGVMLNSIRYAL